MTTAETLTRLADELVQQRTALRQLEQRLTAMAGVVEDLLLQETTTIMPRSSAEEE